MRFIWMAIKTQCRLNWVLRSSFFLRTGIVFLRQGLFVFTWSFFFHHYEQVGGWGFSELLALCGLVSFGAGFVETFFYGLREIPVLVESGQLDTFLLQPRSVLLNVAMAKGDVFSLAEVLYGLVLLFLSGYLFSTPWLLFLFFLPLSVLFMFSLTLYLGSLAFFLPHAHGFIRELYQNARILATQPNSAYRGFVKILTLTLLPVSYLSFFPVQYLANPTLGSLVLTCVGTVLFFICARHLFYRGIDRYESGSLFSHRR